jgi:copper oxidase (laccase) domain-containing protein
VRAPRVYADFPYYLDGFDGVLSRERERAVGLVTGDCIPLTLWSNTSPFHAVIHIGLLGALNRTAANAVEVAAAIGHPTADLECYLGAAVGQSQYDLSRSGLWTAIEADAYNNAPEVEHYQVRDGRSLKMDLVGMVRDQLAAASIPAARTHSLADCVTGRDARFFSHSEDTASGLLPTRRLMTVVGYL